MSHRLPGSGFVFVKIKKWNLLGNHKAIEQMRNWSEQRLKSAVKRSWRRQRSNIPQLFPKNVQWSNSPASQPQPPHQNCIHTHTHMHTTVTGHLLWGVFSKKTVLYHAKTSGSFSQKHKQTLTADECVFYPLPCIAMILYHQGTRSCFFMQTETAACPVHVNIRTT